MSIFGKILDAMPEASLVYHIAVNEAHRDSWIQQARDCEFPANRVKCVQRARISNRALVKGLRALRAVRERIQAHAAA